MMDHLERIGRNLVALALYECLHMIVQHLFHLQALALNGDWENSLIFSICFDRMRMSDHNMWAFERYVGFFKKLLLDSFMENKFMQRTHVSHITFKFLCKWLGPCL